MKFEEDWLELLSAFLEDLLPTKSGQRGLSSARSGHVRQISLMGKTCIEGSVQDSRYDVHTAYIHLDVDDEMCLFTECTCSEDYDCKHTVALALALLYEACDVDCEAALEVNRRLRGGWEPVRKVVPPDFSKETLELFTYAGKDERGGSSRDSAKTKKAPWWVRVVEASSSEARREALSEGLRERVGNRAFSWQYADLVSELLQFSNPVEILRQFDRKIEVKARAYGGQLKARNPGLAVYLDSEEVRLREAEFIRRVAENSLLQWLEKDVSSVSSQRNYVAAEWLIAPGAAEFPSLCFEVLLTTKRLRRSPRNETALAGLVREVERGVRSFGPRETHFLHWIGKHRVCPQYGLNQLGGVPAAFQVQNPIEWISLWGNSELLSWSDGGCVRFDPRPASLVLEASGENRLVWCVSVPGDEPLAPTTAPLDKAAVVACGQAWDYSYSPVDPDLDLFVRQGDTLHRVESGNMPFSVFSALYKSPEIDAGRILNQRTGLSLVRRMGHGVLGGTGERSMAGLVRDVAVVPVVECRYNDESNRISFSAVARSETGITFCRTHLGDWEPSEVRANVDGALVSIGAEEAEDAAAQPAQSQEDTGAVIAAYPRQEDVGPLDEWLRQLIPHDAAFTVDEQGRAVCEWKLHPKLLVRLVQLWPLRPRGVTYLGTRSFERLLTPRSLGAFSVTAEQSGVDWLEVSIKVEKELDAISLDEVAAALDASRESLVLLPGGRLYRRGDLEEYRSKLDALDRMGIDVVSGRQRVHAFQLSGLQDESLRAIAGAGGGLDDLARKARKAISGFAGVPASSIHACVAPVLRAYQREGVDFIVWAAKTFGGAVLADDMGLGKTVEVLAALTALRAGVKNPKPTLVVCPASVAHNWLRETNRFTPHLKAVVVERGAGRRSILDRLGEFDLVIKNYALTRRDIDHLARQDWLLVCVDEAQAIKNPQAQITAAVKSLRAQYRYALTGTPIENRLSDLWSIADFAVPGYLRTLDSFEQRAKQRGGTPFHSVLRARLRPILIRRLKTNVAPELPPRIEERRDCQMIPSQRKDYLAELKKARMLLRDTPTDEPMGKHRIILLAALTRLRQICCDPALVGLSDSGSGKVNEVLELVPPLLEAGQKILLFSQFVRMLKRLDVTLKEHGVRTYMLTGETTQRQALVDTFEQDPSPSVFLISLKAGGQGLNLVSASHVILFDPWWNPAVEAQAIDRTHRIGQDKTVVAVRLVTEETVEERILELQERKLGLVKNVLEESTFNRSLTRDDLEYLLDE